MKRSIVAAVALSCVVCVAGGSAVAADAAPVKVFDAAELTLDRYTVVEADLDGNVALGRSGCPNYDDAGAAIAALTAKAADEGADGVINLHCLNDTGGWGGGYFCYGLAIKLK